MSGVVRLTTAGLSGYVASAERACLWISEHNHIEREGGGTYEKEAAGQGMGYLLRHLSCHTSMAHLNIHGDKVSQTNKFSNGL